MLFPREEPAGYPAAVAVPETRARAARGTRDITSDAFRTTDRQFPATRIADGQPPTPPRPRIHLLFVDALFLHPRTTLSDPRCLPACLARAKNHE